MAKTSQDYWIDRFNNRLVTSEQLAYTGIQEILPLYDKALKNIDKEILSIYDNYSKKGVLDVNELKKGIGVGGKNDFLRKISKTAKELGLNPKKIYDERYLYRLTRLQALQEQIKLEVMKVAKLKTQKATDLYRKVIEDTYEDTQQTFSELGIQPAFAKLDKKIVDAILRSEWEGSNYSNRIWANTEKLAVQLQTIVGSGLTSGQSYQKTSREIRDTFNVSLYDATRLVRTETNYMNGQAELQSFIDDGIEEYEYSAKLDNRTSRICRHLNGRVYKVSDAKPGINYPPMHPHCRSTVVPYFGEGIGEDGKTLRQRADRISPTMGSTKERLQRFKPISNDLQQKWKENMQAQMTPEKATYDYNAELNNLTQTLKGDDLVKRIDDMMRRMPEDYPLRPAIENIAKLNGWKPEALSEVDKVLNERFKESGVSLKEINLSQEQKDFANISELKIQNVRTGTDDVGGVYNNKTNTISLDVANLKQFGKDLGIDNYVEKVVKHEMGHAVDNFAPQLKANVKEFSTSQEFSGINEANRWAVAQSRMADTIQDSQLQKSVRNMTPEVFKMMTETSDSYTVNGIKFQPSRYMEQIRYFLQSDELFAESYSLFHTNPSFLKDKAPELHEYISNINKYKL